LNASFSTHDGLIKKLQSVIEDNNAERSSWRVYKAVADLQKEQPEKTRGKLRKKMGLLDFD